MRILQLTPGTGNFYCGSCLRDNALAGALRAEGIDVVLAPLYLPFALEGPQSDEAAVHMGGINVYLQQKLPWLSHLPRWLADRLDSPRLLRWVSARAGMTEAADLGAMTLSMLRGEEGRQAAELEKLGDWMTSIERPDVVLLSNAMLVGLVHRLRERLDVPILCTLQGEAPFLDALRAPWSERCWKELALRAREVDAFLPVSRYTAELMTERLSLEPSRVHVVPNGIELEGFEVPDEPPAVPTLGYLARLCADKGIDALVEAFLELRSSGAVPGVRLLAGGVCLKEDEPLLAELKRRVARAGASADVEFRRNLTRAQKLELLSSISVLSVPALYGESFGLYVLEALACGVPVVEPRHGGFPELIEGTGAGLLYDPAQPGAHADALGELLGDRERARELGRIGRRAVENAYQARRMASDVADVCRGVLR